ncbi:protein eyes shut [Cylas formicarius]|uniref:protein eyes shut n=1 Tax=Cylas formicarius TaxID=197179 RepID=UPI0029584EA8|nr:protein eyes shut [Cylas formicarius]
MSQTGSASLGRTWLVVALLPLITLVPGVWNGFACLSNPCIHGVCLDDLNSTYFCYCIDGYTGFQCQTNWNECWSSPCQNGGVCVDGIASFNCTCPPGFVGDLCEEDYNECESNPCWNNGTCVDAPNGYICQCPPGYSGTHCEIDIAVCNATGETRCLNGGMCIEGPGDTFDCKCQPGWGGIFCDHELDECMSAPCQNGGVCIDLHAEYSCACLFGYTGKNCEEVIQICKKNPCKNGALCLIEDGVNVCYCVPDYHGDLCQFQYDECQLGPRCLNGGTCIDGTDNFTCSCPPNLTGVFCECLILANNHLDCDYVAPSTTINPCQPTVSTKPTIQTIPTIYSSVFTTPSTSTFFTSTGTTIEVPNATSTFAETTMIGTTTELLIKSTTTQETTTWAKIPVTTESETTATESKTTVSSSNPTFSTESSSSTTEITNKASSTFAEPETTITDESTTTFTMTELEITSTQVPVYSTSITRWIETATTLSSSTITIPTATAITSTNSDVAVFDNFTMSPTSTPWSTFGTKPETLSTTTAVYTSSTSFASTSGGPTTPDQKETNRTFPEETIATQPSQTTFFTKQPTSTVETDIPGSATTPESTTITYFDCTSPKGQCQNGGTCIFVERGHKCVCPFDSEGEYCQIKLGIRSAAFNGNSYLVHGLPNPLNMRIEFEARTLSSSGLIFLATVDSSYMALYIENGFLMFKFSCGYQTMLLTEIKVPVNNGMPINVKAGLELIKNVSHCDAVIKVNDTLSMTGDQMAKVSSFSLQPSWLYLGGIANSVSNDEIPNAGFIGCMSKLKISGLNVNIYKDAKNGYDISECSSLACLSNPCKNGASCTSKGETWTCHCPNGYLGKMCEFSTCDNNPCLFGGTCIPFSSSGYICLCPYGKHGHFCENDLKITETYFSSTVRGLSSFVAYPLPEGISQTLEINFRFTPTTVEQISLLLFIGQSGQHDFFSDHLAVSFVKGYIMLTWNMGSGPRRIFTSQPIERGARDYHVKLGYSGRRAWLMVENLGNVTGRSPGTSVSLDVAPLLYLGGHQAKNFSSLPHDLPLHSGFSGCIFDVEIKSGRVIIPLQGTTNAIGRAVGQCGTTECYERSCQNGGACLHHGSTFMCLCQDNWYGPLCTSRYNLCDKNRTKCSGRSRCVPLFYDYECDCPLGKTGKYCQKDDNFTDISFPGRRSYLSLHPLEMDSSKLNIELHIRALNDHGLILFMGKKDSTYVCLSLLDGLLELKVHSGNSGLNTKDQLTVRSSKLLIKGIWYGIQFGIFGRKVYLQVDHVINVGVMDHGFLLSMSKETIFLGGLPDMSELPLSATSSYPVPYTGCLRNLAINEQKFPLIAENIQHAQNVKDCDGTPCGGEVCQNGGTCWLDSFLKPRCACVEPYSGEKCEIIPECSNATCQNQGRCQNAACSCRVGFGGAFCETEIEVKVPSFSGRSYLLVKKLAEKKRNIRNGDIEKLHLNFTTAKSDGLLLWADTGESFLGMGIERSFIKLAHGSNQIDHEVIEIPSYYKISDGLWHSIQLVFDPPSLKFDGRPLNMPIKYKDSLKRLNLSDEGIFYIGGYPANHALREEQSRYFPLGFEGCVDGFVVNSDKPIRDFRSYEGFNVNVCKIF